MHEPCLLNHSRGKVKHKEVDPIDKEFEDIDIDVIPDVGKGPRLPLSSEEWIVEDVIAHMEERGFGKEGPITSQQEMNAEMKEEFDKEPPLTGILLPRGALDNLWIMPGLILGSQSYKTIPPEFIPCVDLTSAPPWPNVEALYVFPDDLHNFRTAADQSVPRLPNGGKPFNMLPEEDCTYESDAETTSSEESCPRTVFSDEQLSDPVNECSFSTISTRQTPIQKSMPSCEQRHNRMRDISVEKRRKNANRSGKENKIPPEVEAHNGRNSNKRNSPAHLSSTQGHCQSLKMSSKSPNKWLRRSVRIEARRIEKGDI